MKKTTPFLTSIFILTSLFTASHVSAQTLEPSDLGQYEIGTFNWTTKQYTSINSMFWLSHSEGKYTAVGKLPNQALSDLSCDPGCALKESSDADIAKLFPQDWIANGVIACIQNKAFAFCRYANKTEPQAVVHWFIVFRGNLQPFPFVAKYIGPSQS
jgi:hypothetical protein